MTNNDWVNCFQGHVLNRLRSRHEPLPIANQAGCAMWPNW
jgi:hypothetical protein